MLILLSAFSFAAGVWRQLYPGPPPPKSDVPQLPPWILILVNAALIVMALSALIGVWFGRAGAGWTRRRGPHPAAVPVPRRSRARPS